MAKLPPIEPAPEANEYSSKDTKLIKKALASYKSKKITKSKHGFSSAVRKYLNEKGRADITRATGTYALKIAKLKFPKGYHNPIPDQYDTIPIEYLRPSFLIPRYQQDIESEKRKRNIEQEKEEVVEESDKGILNAKNVFGW
jgi:hypothetical protein